MPVVLLLLFPAPCRLGLLCRNEDHVARNCCLRRKGVSRRRFSCHFPWLPTISAGEVRKASLPHVSLSAVCCVASRLPRFLPTLLSFSPLWDPVVGTGCKKRAGIPPVASSPPPDDLHIFIKNLIRRDNFPTRIFPPGGHLSMHPAMSNEGNKRLGSLLVLETQCLLR